MGTQLCALNVPLVALVRLNGIYNGLGGGWSSAFPFGPTVSLSRSTYDPVVSSYGPLAFLLRST